MTLWNKIVLAFKAGVLHDYEGALIYLLDKVLNPWLNSDKVSRNVAKAVETLEKVISLTYRYEKYVPACFESRFKALRSAIEALLEALDDGELSSAELKIIFKRIRDVKDTFTKYSPANDNKLLSADTETTSQAGD